VEQFKSQLGPQADAGTLVAGDNHLVVASATRLLAGQALHAINRKTGKEDWTLATPEGWSAEAVLADGDKVLVVQRTPGGWKCGGAL